MLKIVFVLQKNINISIKHLTIFDNFLNQQKGNVNLSSKLKKSFTCDQLLYNYGFLIIIFLVILG